LVCSNAGASRNTPQFIQTIWPNTVAQKQP